MGKTHFYTTNQILRRAAMAMTRIDTVIIGGGQAGLSVSYYLTQQHREHVVLEQANVPANAWRNHRWDSFTLNTPIGSPNCRERSIVASIRTGS
jgi:glycine/D-amino acid oxidase-like deaminating enzyme